MKFLIEIFATYFYIGYLPASGTFATLATMPLVFLFSKQTLYLQIFIVILIFFCGVRISSLAEKYYEKKDDSKIVVDEMLGFLISMWGINILQIKHLVIGFLLFRFLDITKIGFKKTQKISSGLGIMIDDIIAAVITNIILRLTL